MRFELDHLPSKGRHLRFALSDSWAKDAAERALDGEVVALEGHLHAMRSRGGVAVEAKLSGAVRLPCDRCADVVSVPLVIDETLLYLPPIDPTEVAASAAAGRASGKVEIELDEADLDVGWLDHNGIEVSAVVEEALVLALPPRITCPEGSRCANAAAIAAGSSGEESDAPSGHPAFAKLKHLLNPS